MSQPIKHRYVTQKFTCAISRPGSLWSLLTLRLGYCAIEMSHEPLKRSTSVGDKRQWIRPDLPSKCTWHLGIDISESPHQHNKTSTKWVNSSNVLVMSQVNYLLNFTTCFLDQGFAREDPSEHSLSYWKDAISQDKQHRKELWLEMRVVWVLYYIHGPPRNIFEIYNLLLKSSFPVYQSAYLFTLFVCWLTSEWKKDHMFLSLSGEVRVFQRRRLSKGQNWPKDDRGRWARRQN